jgi:hypothetical protein
MTLGFIGILATTTSSDAARLILVAGGGTGGDGSPARSAKLDEPFGVAFDRSGTIYFVEIAGNKARKIDSHGIVTTIAGTGEPADGGDGGPGPKARLNNPHSLALAPDGNLYIADTGSSSASAPRTKRAAPVSADTHPSERSRAGTRSCRDEQGVPRAKAAVANTGTLHAS